MYRRYYKETPPGYSGVRFTGVEEEARLPGETDGNAGRSFPKEEKPLLQTAGATAGCERGSDPFEVSALPPCRFSCTKKAQVSEEVGSKEAKSPVSLAETVERSEKKQGEEVFSAKHLFTLEDLLLIAVLMLLISGEIEEETLLLVGLLVLLLGK